MPARLRTRLALTTILGALLLGHPAAAQDASELVVRLGRIENQSRIMSGQIETLQYENRQLKEQLRKFQEDVEFRLNEGKGGGRSSPSAPSAAPAPSGTVNGGNPGSGRPGKRGDAFDPSQAPGAPGAPMPLGSTPASPPLPAREAAEAAPVRPQAVPRAAIDDEDPDAEGAAPGYDEPVDLRPPARTGAIPVPAARPAESVAATRTGDPSADYETAVELYRSKQYEQAEMGLRQFIQ